MLLGSILFSTLPANQIRIIEGVRSSLPSFATKPQCFQMGIRERLAFEMVLGTRRFLERRRETTWRNASKMTTVATVKRRRRRALVRRADGAVFRTVRSPVGGGRRSPLRRIPPGAVRAATAAVNRPLRTAAAVAPASLAPAPATPAAASVATDAPQQPHAQATALPGRDVPVAAPAAATAPIAASPRDRITVHLVARVQIRREGYHVRTAVFSEVDVEEHHGHGFGHVVVSYPVAIGGAAFSRPGCSQ
mmetsp:Transcript_29403/g.53821  ORF Transcript_29403/g.53821 Transcript_29403/m.53821 type:complete len:249 (+) Transcript_29403:3094-3840(+)